ncbi:hypothetical protein N7462_006811 [Penicillium macrosclerotiorum]|uniref:uncharacterized protein n=1 Tax=Penicillium macrosclerotiorum TaxID=303699 RepID=UPI002548E467|nr:uncharacterized protein N7462_006811 [Penicillium macrosclerotiorum]KAJ5683646.1 hypothetical protein N7462_006811 [Penicillium macrosclerotiorum]
MAMNDTGVFGVALPYVGTDFGYALSYLQQEIATAATTVGAIFGAAILGLFADRWGRKPCLLISDLLFTAGAIIIASSFSLRQLVAGRLILGVGVSGAAVICPLYITELAPTAVRGRCVGTNSFCIPFGQTVAVAIGAGWRMSTATRESCLVLELYPQFCSSLSYTNYRNRPVFLSPVTKMTRLEKYSKEFTSTLRLKYYGLSRIILLRLWPCNARPPSVNALKSYRLTSLIAIFGQVTGYNTLLYYAGTLFKLLGLSNAVIRGLIPSITNTFFLLCGIVMVDRIGRRGLLMKFGPIMVIGLIWCLVAFYYICKPTGHFLIEGHTYP